MTISCQSAKCPQKIHGALMTDISGISFMLLQGPNSPAVPLKRIGFFKKILIRIQMKNKKGFFNNTLKSVKGQVILT